MQTQPTLFKDNSRSAIFCRDRVYRYTLWRRWSEGHRYVNFICLNPSTADEHKNDRTIVKCMKFARSWGYDAMCVTNLFAYRATNPKVMMAFPDPIGYGNNRHILNIAKGASLIVAAWSQYGNFLHRSTAVRNLLEGHKLHYLRITNGEPWHPLYLPDITRPSLWK